MKRKMIIFSNFNTNTFNLSGNFHVDIFSREWLSYRMKIFMTYTRKSLESQTNQNFLALISIHPDSIAIIDDLLKQYPILPSNIIFTPDRNSLIIDYIKGSDEVFLSKIDSDDIYHPSYISQLYEYEPKKNTAVLINQSGYIYDTNNDLLANYENISPAFYTQIFSVDDYVNVYQYYPEISHVYIQKLPYEAIKRKNFIVVAHNNNVYTHFTNQYKNSLISEDKEKLNVLKEFHIL